ncbi:MAG: glutamate synthase central domain-containing protein, partial [Candidatus Omnitrophica bacterium]|nr:glutamate synthase central domain-containing protein [Candidatus Omnitrophota bacterium]
MGRRHFPLQQGLYDPRFEKDNCGVGFVCDIKGKKSHNIVEQSLTILQRLAHRGATGADPKTGDGAGLLLQMPHGFFIKEARKEGISLPEPGAYGTGLVFLPPDIEERLFCKDIFYKIIKKEGQVLLGWRRVPVNNSGIGKTARDTQPAISQVFIGKGEKSPGGLDFERKLYIIRKQIEASIYACGLKQKSFFYITNLSSRTFSYKGLLMPVQLKDFFLDLKDESLVSAIALVHSRYSTNTFPTWDLAQPFRFLAHNGEINTLKGNVNWMKARQASLKSDLFKSEIQKVFPVVRDDLSDSATIDNVFELLVLAGRPMYQAMMMLVPAAWENNPFFSDKLRSFYEYNACFMEPWDGPAAIAFSDGKDVGAVLDRNGLRPARYIITKQGLAVLASEVGVLDIEASDIVCSGRLEPGKMLYIDTCAGRVISDEEIKERVSQAKPYKAWIEENMLDIAKLPPVTGDCSRRHDTFRMLKIFGYSREDLKRILSPMAQTGVEPTGSMGNDTPLAVLSLRQQPLYNYFKQLFAQVTNPAIDSIREECVMSLTAYLGQQNNILEETPYQCHSLKVDEPILTDIDLEKIRHIKDNGFKAKTISMLFKAAGKNSLIDALDSICSQAQTAISGGCSFIILSDRGVDEHNAAIPALLALGALHQSLIKKSLRTRVSIIVESGEPREVHHFALLFGFGADCVNPYLAYEAIGYLKELGLIETDVETGIKQYRKALAKGILKIISKMGISTLRSYKGAQIFECLGLNQAVIERCFCGTPSRIGGAGFEVIKKEALMRHNEAFNSPQQRDVLTTGGIYQYKRDGEFHLWNPQSISMLQESVHNNDYSLFKEFSKLIDEQSSNPATLRGFLNFKKTKPLKLSEVEPLEGIFKRFATGAMSFGSISRPAHETLALAMNRLGGKSNTGEGGEDPERFKPLPNGDSRRSAIKQVASGRFGVTT